MSGNTLKTCVVIICKNKVLIDVNHNIPVRDSIKECLFVYFGERRIGWYPLLSAGVILDTKTYLLEVAETIFVNGFSWVNIEECTNNIIGKIF